MAREDLMKASKILTEISDTYTRHEFTMDLVAMARSADEAARIGHLHGTKSGSD